MKHFDSGIFSPLQSLKALFGIRECGRWDAPTYDKLNPRRQALFLNSSMLPCIPEVASDGGIRFSAT